MGVHAAGTQRGLAYRLAPLQGTRAPLIIALESRASAAHVPFHALQQLIWQIDGGLSYSEMPAQSQQLINQLVPDYRSELREDFFTALQNKSNGIGGFLNNLGFHNAGNLVTGTTSTLTQEYQRIHNALIQDANNYEALAHDFVNVLPGTAPNPGPTSWSQLNPRVYARLVGGNIYGETGTLEVRVLPSATSNASASAQGSPSHSTHYAAEDIDPVDVPLEAVIAYPNASTMQGLTGIPVVGDSPSSLVVLNYKVTAQPQTYTLLLPPKTIVNPSCSSPLDVTKSNCLPRIIYDYIPYRTSQPTEAEPVTLTLWVKNPNDAAVPTPTSLTATAVNNATDPSGVSPTFELTKSGGPTSVPANGHETLTYVGIPCWTAFEMVSPSSWVYQDVQMAAQGSSVQGDVATLLGFIHDLPGPSALSAVPGIALGTFQLLSVKGVLFFQFDITSANLSSKSAITIWVLDQPQKLDIFAAYMIGVFSGMANVTPIPTEYIDATLSDVLDSISNNKCDYEILSHNPLPNYTWFYNSLTMDLKEGEPDGIARSTILGQQIQCEP